MSTANALHSLYGGKAARKALAGNVGGQVREQTVITPRWLIDQLRKVEGSIGVDPCSTQDNPCGATLSLCGPDAGADGLVWSWATGAGPFYANPPYADLRAWLEKARAEFNAGARGWLLGPVRTQRKWFLPLLRGKGIKVACLAPLAFEGHKQSFPAPLFLAAYGVPVPRLRDPRGGLLITGRL